MNQTQLAALRSALRHELERMDAITVNCKSCTSWKVSRCAQFDQVPPLDVQSVGCEEWSWDGVPF